MAKRKKNTIPQEFPEPEKNPEFNPDIMPDEDNASSDEDDIDIIFDDAQEPLPPHEKPSPGEGP